MAQRRPTASPEKPAAQAPAPKRLPAPPPTFDTLLAADSYRVYSEVRGVGQLIRSPAVTDLLDPVMKLGGPPKEFNTILKWLNTQADALATFAHVCGQLADKTQPPNGFDGHRI